MGYYEDHHRTHYLKCAVCGKMTEFTEEGFNAEYLEPLCSACESSGEVPQDFNTPSGGTRF